MPVCLDALPPQPLSGDGMAGRAGKQRTHMPESHHAQLLRNLELLVQGQQLYAQSNANTREMGQAASKAKVALSSKPIGDEPRQEAAAQGEVVKKKVHWQPGNEHQGQQHQHMPRIVFKDGHPVKARPTILLQVNSARSTTPPPTLSASHRHPADLKRKTLDFGQLPSAAAARRQDSSDSGPSRTAASQHGTVKLSRFGSDPAAQPALREQLAQGLVNEPLGPEPESPWKISAPLQQQPASKGPTFFQLQHPATTKIIKAEPAAQDSSAHAEADAAASTLPRTAQSACGPEPRDSRPPKKRRPTPPVEEAVPDDSVGLESGERRLSFAYMAQAAHNAQDDLHEARPPARETLPAPKPLKPTAQKAKSIAGKADAKSAKLRPVLKGLSALEQLANAASWHEEAERAQKAGEASPSAPAAAAGASAQAEDPPRAQEAQAGPALQKGSNGEPIVFAPQPLPHAGSGLARRVSNQSIVLKLGSQKPQQQLSDSQNPASLTATAWDQAEQPASAFQPAARSLSYMRGFHSTPAAVGHRVEAQSAPMLRCISADLLVPPRPKSPSPLPPLLPLQTHIDDKKAGSQAGRTSAHREGTWAGRVKHRLDTGDGHSTVELFSCQAAFPEAIHEQLPPVVFVSDLASRDQVRLKRHSVHHLQLGAITQKQHLKLLGLAAMKLVGISRLQHCDMLFVFEVDVRNRVQVLLFVQTEDL